MHWVYCLLHPAALSAMANCDNPDCIQLHESFLKSQQELTTLKQLAKTVTCDFGSLQQKYEDNIRQYEELKQTLQQREETMHKMEALVKPALTEHENLRTKYRIVKRLTTDAELYASQLYRQNTSLKRQSQQLLEVFSSSDVKVDLSKLHEITEEKDTEPTDTDLSDTKRHTKIVLGLEERIANLEQELQVAQSQCHVSAHAAYQQNGLNGENVDELSAKEKYFREECERLKTANISLQEEKEKEELLKNDAIAFASELYSRCDAMKRQSDIAISAIMNDEKLMKCMMEIEKVSKEREEIRLQYMRQIADLEGAVKASQDSETLLKEQLQQSQEKNSKLLQDVKALEKEKEELRANTWAAPPAPPPPPPPSMPLPLKPSVDTGIISSSKSTTTKPKVHTERPAGYVEELEAMMKRIQGKGAGRKQSVTAETNDSTVDDNSGSDIINIQHLLSGAKTGSKRREWKENGNLSSAGKPAVKTFQPPPASVTKAESVSPASQINTSSDNKLDDTKSPGNIVELTPSNPLRPPPSPVLTTSPPAKASPEQTKSATVVSVENFARPPVPTIEKARPSAPAPAAPVSNSGLRNGRSVPATIGSNLGKSVFVSLNAPNRLTSQDLSSAESGARTDSTSDAKDKPAVAPTSIKDRIAAYQNKGR